jgi:3-dehydroshikimate dehydratase
MAVLHPGLVSVTFRNLEPSEVIRVAAEAGLEGIEWGGDVHVPPTNTANARAIGQETRAAGLAVAAYGSYYRAGEEGADTFTRILETAQALETRVIRIWAGKLGSAQADTDYRKRVTDDCRRIAEMAAAAKITIACEWHGGTLTDTAASAATLFAEVAHPNLKTYWQPRRQQPFDFCLEDMEAALPHLVGLHVFRWDAVTGERRPLAEGAADWAAYLKKAMPPLPTDTRHYALLEFVKGDDPAQMAQDAATLRAWLQQEG